MDLRWALIHGRYGRLEYGIAVLYVFVTTLHGGALGALMTFSSRLWYPYYERAGMEWGVNAVKDQQLAGLIMWVPAGVILVQEAERSSRAGRATAAAGTPALLMLMFLLLIFACAKPHEKVETGGGDLERGKLLIQQYGCQSCHSVPGISGPKGAVGPPLDRIALRSFIAGKVQNTPQNMEIWIQNPQAFDPANAMPNLGIPQKDARDITAYLFTLK